MNVSFPDPSTSHNAIFASLRAKLCREVSGSTMLLALLQKVNRLQETHTVPEAFKTAFDEFLARADDHIGVVRPFFPLLVCFLPSHPGALCDPRGPECYPVSSRTTGIPLAS
jgi:hypothetical protein